MLCKENVNKAIGVEEDCGQTKRLLPAEARGCVVRGKISSERPRGGLWEQLSRAPVSYCINDDETWSEVFKR